MKHLFEALRPRHCIKNFFIFLPVIFGGKLFDPETVLKVAAAFFLFSMVAGASYILNDIIDLKNDTKHPAKRFRAIASGKVLVKDAVIIDVFSIAGFFFLRILAGSVVAGVELSHWIISMVVLLALFLGFNKRWEELRFLNSEAGNHRKVLSKYNAYFIDQMTAVITSSIVVVYMLYTVDTRTVQEFGTKNLIYTIPFVYYGIFRYLYIGHKIMKGGDPVKMLLSDKLMQLNILLHLLSESYHTA